MQTSFTPEPQQRRKPGFGARAAVRALPFPFLARPQAPETRTGSANGPDDVFFISFCTALFLGGLVIVALLVR